MIRQKLHLLLFLLLCSCIAFAQERTITGKITDESTKAPLTGATVIIKGTKRATTTDADGNFSIKGPDGKVTLIVTSIGFASKEISAPAGAGVLSIVLGTDSKQLGEVVVTALGITRQSKTLVYATQTVPTGQLTEVRASDNFLGSLSGKVANVEINQGSGGLGSGAKIVLRGNKSIQGSNNALIVVDGVPINNETYSAAGNDFGSVQSSDGASNINPDDIESVTVLRGASAAALYGSQAGNGVMVITTKKGRKGHVDVTVNSGLGFERPFALPDFQNTYGQGSGGVLHDSSQAGASWGPKMTGQAYTDYLYKQNTLTPQKDNIKDFFRTGLSLNNSVGVSAGSDHIQSYFSYTNNYAKGIIRNNDLNRHTLNWRITTQINSKFSTDAKITYVAQNINGRPRTGEENSPVFDAYEMPRSLKTSDARNYQSYNSLDVAQPTNWPSTNNSIYQNPYWMINNTAINETRSRVIGFAALKYQITPWLSLRGSANLDRTADQIEEKYQQSTLLWNTNAGGSYNVTNLVRTNKWFDLILEGNNQLSKDFKLGYHIGAIYQDNIYAQQIAGSNGLFVPNKFSLSYASNPSITQDGSEVVTQSVFGQANLSWKDAIFLDASLRNDWDSRIPSPYHYSYPSIGVSALLSELTQLPEAISFLKVSANYAQVGNGGQFGVTNAAYNYVQGAGNGSIARSTVLNIPGLKPELVKSYEFGVESRFVKDRIGFTATYYKSNSTNQLLKLGLPVATGYLTQYINAGNIENHGIELVINGSPIKGRDFTWDININLSLNRNKIIKLSPELKQTDLGGGDNRSALPVVKEGGSYGDLYAFQWLKGTKGQYLTDSSGAPYTSYASGDPIGFIGNFNPKELVGMTNTFQYKRFSLRFLIDGRIGGILESGTEMNLAFSGITKGTEKFREGGWNLGGSYFTSETPNSTTITSQKFWQTVSGQRYGVGEFFAYNATAIRMRELSIGYDIPLKRVTVIKSMRFSAVARNLFWIYRGSSILSIPGIGKRKMWMDPDMSNGNSNFQGTEYGAMPSSRTLGFNLKVNF